MLQSPMSQIGSLSHEIVNENQMKIIRTANNLEQVIWKEVIEKFAKAKNAEEIDQLFNSLMTFQERETVARRLAVLALVKKGFSYKQISEQLWVSPVTISVMKKSFFDQQGYQSYREMKNGHPSKPMGVSSDSPQESAFSKWLDYVAIVSEGFLDMTAPRWKFLSYNSTLLKKYRKRNPEK